MIQKLKIRLENIFQFYLSSNIEFKGQNKQEFNMLRQSMNGLKAAGTNFFGAKTAVENWKGKRKNNCIFNIRQIILSEHPMRRSS